MSAANTIQMGSTTPTTEEEQFISGYQWMLLARLLEDKLTSLYRAGKIVGGVYVGKGQEAFSAALAMQLSPKQGDVYGPLIRDQAGRLAFGENLMDSIRTYLGSVEGPMRGRDGNIHRGRPRDGMTAMISHLGAGISVINGMLMANRFQGKTGVVGAACIGDGGTSTGSFHEAMNQAAVEKLPLVVAIANNLFAYSTPNDRQFACKDLVDRAIGYGIAGHHCDGTRLEDCLSTFEEAVAKARSGEGPQMVVGHMLRLSGHGQHDDGWYVPESLKVSSVGQDCIDNASKYLLKREWATEDELAAWEKKTRARIDRAVSKVSKEPKPDGARENWYALSTKHLCEGTPEV